MNKWLKNRKKLGKMGDVLEHRPTIFHYFFMTFYQFYSNFIRILLVVFGRFWREKNWKKIGKNREKCLKIRTVMQDRPGIFPDF